MERESMEFDVVIVGGGGLDRDTGREARQLGWPVLQSYGMTESTVLTHSNRPGRTKLGTVGQILDGNADRRRRTHRSDGLSLFLSKDGAKSTVPFDDRSQSGLEGTHVQ